MATMNISLPDPMKEFVESEVAAGSYGNASEYIRQLLREAQERKANEKLERLLIEGMNSGEPIEATPEFWANMRQDIKKRITEHKKKHGRS
jgi:antitoxin ParD1/3/4